MLPFVGNNRHHSLVKASLSFGQIKKKLCSSPGVSSLFDTYHKGRLFQAASSSTLAAEGREQKTAVLTWQILATWKNTSSNLSNPL
jgi:hypothetical protein